MSRLLLISSSNVHGTGYLDHCEPYMRALLGAALQRVLFVPYALAKLLHDPDRVLTPGPGVF